jgi:choline monooxygenase
MSQSLREKLRLFDSNAALEHAQTIPSLWYSDPEIYRAECRHVFGNTWQLAGRLNQLSEPGSFLTTDIAGEPILVLRDAEGTLRAFFNVCRHRAAPVVPEAAGKATRLRCRYHGWTYDLAGRLRGAPEFEGVADFEREQHGLVSLAVAVWGPFVWVHPEPMSQPLAEFLVPLPQRTADVGLDALRWVARREYQLACNWKVFVDNYLDGGYHVNTVHPGLAGIVDYAHYRTEIAGNTSVQISPLRPAEGPGEASAVGQVRTGNMAYYWWVFPNLMINLYQGVMDTNLVLPLGPDRCRVIFDFYFARTDGPTAEHFMAESVAVAHQIQLEDVAICEEVQRGLASRSFDTGRFSVRREGAGYHFHCLLARHLQQATATGPG